MSNHVTLKSVEPPANFNGLRYPRFTARVRVIGAGREPFTLNVWANCGDLRPWVVESDCERGFRTLREARAYINRFFETAK